MKNLANTNVQALTVYSPPLEGRSAYNGLLLDFNERTTQPSRQVRNAITQASKRVQMYPEYGKISDKIAKYAGVKSNQILVTNGGDQGIDIVFRAFTQAGDTVIVPTPSFAMFTQSAGMVGNKVVAPEYSPIDGSFPLQKVLDSIKANTRLVIICNPNNPTGTLVSQNDIENILQSAPNAMVLVDEAYFEFAQESASPLIERYSNLVIVRTFSKAFGLAALRIGYLISAEANIAELLKVRGPYSVNSIAVAAANAALDDLTYMKTYVDEVIEARKTVTDFFDANKVTYFKSRSNFILFRPTNNSSQTMFEILKSNGILVRPRENNMLRVSIGTRKQIQTFIYNYKKLL